MACCTRPKPSTPENPRLLGTPLGQPVRVNVRIPMLSLRRGQDEWVDGTDVAEYIERGYLTEV